MNQNESVPRSKWLTISRSGRRVKELSAVPRHAKVAQEQRDSAVDRSLNSNRQHCFHCHSCPSFYLSLVVLVYHIQEYLSRIRIVFIHKVDIFVRVAQKSPSLEKSNDDDFLLNYQRSWNFFHEGIAIAHTATPARQMIIHTKSVGVQLFVASASAANPLVAIAAPTYVQELSIPDIVDTLPYLAKFLGTTTIKRKLTPCIQPTSTAISSILQRENRL